MKLGLAVFGRTCHGLVLEGVIILCVMWLRIQEKPLSPMAQNTLDLILCKYTQLIVGYNHKLLGF